MGLMAHHVGVRRPFGAHAMVGRPVADESCSPSFARRCWRRQRLTGVRWHAVDHVSRTREVLGRLTGQDQAAIPSKPREPRDITGTWINLEAGRGGQNSTGSPYAKGRPAVLQRAGPPTWVGRQYFLGGACGGITSPPPSNTRGGHNANEGTLADQRWRVGGGGHGRDVRSTVGGCRAEWLQGGTTGGEI